MNHGKQKQIHPPIAICWLRRDLRLEDNAALAAATHSGAMVVVVFVFDTTILDTLQDRDDRRVTFIHETLTQLHQQLAERRSGLVVLHGDPTVEIPKLAKILSANAVYVASDYEPDAKRRDAAVATALQKVGAAFINVKDQVIFAGDEVLNQSGLPFRVFTPYSRAWWRRLRSDDVAAKPVNQWALAIANDIPVKTGIRALEVYGFIPAKLMISAGPSAAMSQLKHFLPRLHQYAQSRDFPGIAGTSQLSVHLRFGTVSVRELVRSVLAAVEEGDQGAATWLKELMWRDFYHMVLDHNPEVVTQEFDPQYRGMSWPGRLDHFERWCAGETGYPIVDAGMRQLIQTGWMHNRVRMITAMFLSKHLLVDWRLGERFFARHLLDYDLASNNGGWQWSASTGCDAQPYFRIFNPVAQGQRFDADGTYIRKYCPQLNNADNKTVHWPHENPQYEIGITSYPLPIVDHAASRQRALEFFKRQRQLSRQRPALGKSR